MARITGSNGGRTAEAIRRAAIRLIHRQGFAAMNLRELAAEVGIQPGSLYNHIETKQGLLFELMREHMQDLLSAMEAALAAAPDEPMAQLRAFLAQHVLYHLERKQEVYIANFELRALEPANAEPILAMRREYEDRLIGLLEAGARAGELQVADARIAAYALLAMLTGVCTWYRPGGRLGPEEIVAQHLELALSGVSGAGLGQRAPDISAGGSAPIERMRSIPAGGRTPG
ncbi:TetR/AcrR family transcriptional regulator [Siccirubricoccus sp. KC 17139]|uniref:TetR/AcrR family transcriptional regulator n=1 Tax=Siccirubricoccus soli TaxID=2899147 RepID=A0ABT1D6V5_9PROT|nr:TetR/AcrR family transcriptional regulator [Siccirubricoccus soli]MCO6417665.1 TetR/AcrR family transcriptional regulator [Siccirubricoccus soli]MCP2683800.1 TetR/AcrR family transcriptional regulator [Siccirubricoccus soli]